jgi:hypothetical protein
MAAVSAKLQPPAPGLARTEIEARPREPAVEAHDMALAGIAVEPKRPEGAEIAIMLSGAGGLTHWVERPAAIVLQESGEGGRLVLAIESNDGRKSSCGLAPPPCPNAPMALHDNASREGLSL